MSNIHEYRGKIRVVVLHRIEILAKCKLDDYASDCFADSIEEGECYKVERFVSASGYYPYGVKLQGNPGLFFMQRFDYFILNLN